jgi:hypothetical protein
MEVLACASLIFRSYSAYTSLVHACELQSSFSAATEPQPWIDFAALAAIQRKPHSHAASILSGYSVTLSVLGLWTLDPGLWTFGSATA